MNFSASLFVEGFSLSRCTKRHLLDKSYMVGFHFSLTTTHYTYKRREPVSTWCGRQHQFNATDQLENIKKKNVEENHWSNTLITSRYYFILLHFLKNQILCIQHTQIASELNSSNTKSSLWAQEPPSDGGLEGEYVLW